MFSPESIERECKEFLIKISDAPYDSAHDLAHTERVVRNARSILEYEDGDPMVVIPAAWLHDCVVLPKDHPERKRASTLAARKASDFLEGLDYPQSKILETAHAIEAHSFSAGIPAETLEAKIVQDADRLDSLGAIGVARTLIVGGKLDRPLYHPEDPFCTERSPEDDIWTIDHFYEKLFKLPDMMHTDEAKKIARRRVAFMKGYLSELKEEIKPSNQAS